MRCRMTASLRATATLALRRLLRLAIRIPQDLSADHFAMRVSSTRWVGVILYGLTVIGVVTISTLADSLGKFHRTLRQINP